jgi:hypothetical protein
LTDHVRGNGDAGGVLRRQGPSGAECEAVLLRRQIEFTDGYTYWPNGHLRERRISKPGEVPSQLYYPEDGGEPLPAPPSGC